MVGYKILVLWANSSKFFPFSEPAAMDREREGWENKCTLSFAVFSLQIFHEKTGKTYFESSVDHSPGQLYWSSMVRNTFLEQIPGMPPQT
jgi:hypothetical protein